MEKRTCHHNLLRALFCMVCMVIAPATEAIGFTVPTGLQPPRPDDAGFKPVLGTYS